MSAFLLTAALVLGAGPQQAGNQGTANPTTPHQGAPNPNNAAGTNTVPNVDGEWTVVCVESHGKRIDTSKDATVTIKNNVLSFEHAGQQRSVHLVFGIMNTVTVSPEATGAKHATPAHGAKTAPAEATSTAKPAVRPIRGAAQTPGAAGAAPAQDAATGVAKTGTATTAAPTAGAGQAVQAGTVAKGNAAAEQGAPEKHGQKGETVVGDTGTHRGTYILSPDYLCIGLDPEIGQPAAAAPGAPAAGAVAQKNAAGAVRAVQPVPRAVFRPGMNAGTFGQPQFSGFVLILHRQSGSQHAGR
jgi:hypothetical protein